MEGQEEWMSSHSYNRKENVGHIVEKVEICKKLAYY
jgi:hypothetical protein